MKLSVPFKNMRFIVAIAWRWRKAETPMGDKFVLDTRSLGGTDIQDVNRLIDEFLEPRRYGGDM